MITGCLVRNTRCMAPRTAWPISANSAPRWSMVGMSIARSTRSGTLVGPGICRKCLPVCTVMGVLPGIVLALQAPEYHYLPSLSPARQVPSRGPKPALAIASYERDIRPPEPMQHGDDAIGILVLRMMAPLGRVPHLSGRHRLPAVCSDSFIHQDNNGVEHGMTHALMLGDELHQLVGTFDIDRAIVERARSRSRTRQAFCGRSIFLEWYEFIARGTELDAHIKDKVVYRTRLLEIGMHRFLCGSHAVLGDAPVIAGQKHGPFGQGHEKRVVNTQLYRQFYLAFRGIETNGIDILLDVAKDLVAFLAVKACDLEVGRQSHL